MKAKENTMHNVITIDKETRKEIKLVYIYDAAKILDVSKQRISQLVKDGILDIYNVYGLPFFKITDIENYAKTRKVGRPAKK